MTAAAEKKTTGSVLPAGCSRTTAAPVRTAAFTRSRANAMARFPAPVGKQAGLSIDESGPPPFSLLETTQPPILVACPPHYVGVNALQEAMQSRPAELAIVIHPAAHDRIDPLCEFCEAGPDALIDPPATDLLALRFEGVRADRRRERREQLPIPVLRTARTELIPQERERRMLVRAAPIIVPAIHYPGLPGMQPQPQAFQPLRESITHLARLILGRTMQPQILYRFPRKSFSKSPIDTRSTPAAPLLALTRLYASHTSCFGIVNGLSF